MEITELKKRYAEYEKSYSLPIFRELNEVFEIDKIDRDSEFFLRAVRKQIMEKIVNSMSFLDMLLNPANAPRMYYSYLKSMSSEDKKIIEAMYGKFADLSMISLSLEVNYNELGEAELIKNSLKLWKEISGDFGKIISHIIKPENSVKKERSYFG